jgi:tetratricopeptide (TPR) repeat protein
MSKLIYLVTIVASVGIEFLGTTSAIAMPRHLPSHNLIAQEGQMSAGKFNQLGITLRDRKKYENAIEAFNLSIKYFPNNNNEAYLERGKTYLEMGKPINGLKDFSVVIENDPRNLEARIYRGSILCTYAGQVDDKEAKQKAIEIGQKDISVGLEILGPNDNSGLVDKLKKVSQACGNP